MLKGFQSSFVASSVVYAKLVWIWQVLKLSKDMGLQKMMIESDSMLALQLIQSTSQQWHWTTQTILLTILHLCTDREVRMTHILREGNSIVDALAKMALDQNSSQIYEPENLPISIRQLAYRDKVGKPYIRKVKFGCSYARVK